MIGKLRYVDPVNDRKRPCPPVCDVCGELATESRGLNPPNAAMRVTDRCDEHRITDREWSAISEAAGL